MVGACNSAVDRRLGGVPYSSSSYDRVNVQRWRDESANATGMGGWADGRRGYRGGRGRRPDHQQSSFQHGGVKKRGVRGGSEQRAVPLMCDSRRAWAVLRSSREGEQAGPTFLRHGMVPSLCATVPQLSDNGTLGFAQCQSALWRTSLFRMDHGLDGGWVGGSWVVPAANTGGFNERDEETVAGPRSMVGRHYQHVPSRGGVGAPPQPGVRAVWDTGAPLHRYAAHRYAARR